MKSVNNATAPGYGFNVASPASACPDSIHIRNVQSSAGWTYQADSLMYLDVAGIQTFSFGTMQMAPRFDSDFTNHGLAGVPPGTISKVSFSAFPNPARVTKVNFALAEAVRRGPVGVRPVRPQGRHARQGFHARGAVHA